MKKKLLSSIFALALLATAGYGVNKSMNSDANLSDLALANVEALASNENNGNKARDKIDYTRTYETTLYSGEVFSCKEYGTACAGEGNIDCLQWSRTDCFPI